MRTEGDGSDPPLRIPLGPVALDPVSLDGATERAAELIDGDRFAHVVTANTDFVHQMQTDTDLRRIVSDADLVVADGVPLLWMARWVGTPLPGRVNGTDLVVRLLRMARARGWRVVGLGADPGVAAAASAAAEARWGCRFVGVDAPAREELEDETRGAEIARWVAGLDADLLLLATGGGHQEHWIDRHRARLGSCTAIGVGSALDFVAGTRPRAPVVMQRTGLEWLWRLGNEPARLWRRYLVDDMSVLVRFLRENPLPKRDQSAA